jgi:hypothetical protein
MRGAATQETKTKRARHSPKGDDGLPADHVREDIQFRMLNSGWSSMRDFWHREEEIDPSWIVQSNLRGSFTISRSFSALGLHREMGAEL